MKEKICENASGGGTPDRKSVCVLGSTGSIGTQTLDVIRSRPGDFRIAALSAGHNAERLLAQAREFHPDCVAVSDDRAAFILKGLLPAGIRLISGHDASGVLASVTDADIIVNGISGRHGTEPFLAAMRAGKTVAAANKESIIYCHELMSGYDVSGRVIPIDSEQSAIFQCLPHDVRHIKRLILTASGGAFRGYTRERLMGVTREQALFHPVWHMGRKVTLDSATLVNKGLEVMEASYLFGISADDIDVLVHPQSIVHSLVELTDGSTIAQLAAPDMRLAIQYALTYPERKPCSFGALDLAKAGRLTFERPDMEAFPALPLAYEALRAGGALPVCYCAASEEASELFMAGGCTFYDIPGRIEYAMGRLAGKAVSTLEDIYNIDKEARRLALAGREQRAVFDLDI